MDLTADDSRESEGLRKTKVGFKSRGITALVKQSSEKGAGMVADSGSSAFLRQRHSLLKATLDNVKRSSGKFGEGEEGEGGGREFRVTEKALNDALEQMMSAVADWGLEEGDKEGGDNDNDDDAGNLGFLSVEDIEDDL